VLSIADLHQTYPLESDCDWAALLAAYVLRMSEGDSIPEFAKDDFAALMQRNPAYALKSHIMMGFIGAIPLVQAPPFAGQAITEVEIVYDWGGMGESVHYEIRITEADTSPNVTVQTSEESLPASVGIQLDPAVVQALGPALTNLLPTQRELTLVPCTDSFPDWHADLAFKDNRRITLSTYRSNFFGLGGPWQTEIDGQKYISYSSQFVKAVFELLKALELEPGQPMGMYCNIDQMGEVLDLAYP